MHPDHGKCGCGNYSPDHPSYSIVTQRDGVYEAKMFGSFERASAWLREEASDGKYGLVNLSSGLVRTVTVSTERHVTGVGWIG